MENKVARKKLINADVIEGAVLSFLSLGAYTWMRCGSFHADAFSRPGLSSSFFPELSLLFLGGLSLALLAKGLANRSAVVPVKENASRLDRSQIRQVVAITVTMLAYVHLIEPLGYYLSSVLAMIAVMVILGIRSRLRLLLVPVGLMVVVYLFFELTLKIMIPRGLFF